ncbi:MAG: murein biosynthesis integral membrane protein MurJ [Gammaproteobacteria bacterium]|nr:murein biosynthesis integral membrane protein MurJ [Gammaproteobacteria bacterium]MDH5727705.1 murein biosynthesis integral membrane protein MurJ [Gammaproteobacteria bacterium]
MTMISRVLGFVRDMVFARIFGADAATDAFFVAFKIPNFLRRLFAEGAFSQAFVPVLTDYKENKSEAEVKELIDRVAGTFGLILLVITLIGVVAAPLLIMVFGPGFLDEPEKYDLAVEMLKLTFPYLFFIALTAFAGAILNSYGRFAVPAFTPVLLNVCLISAAIWLAPQMEKPIVALAWGVFFAGLSQLLFQFPFLWRMGKLARPRWGGQHEGVRRIMKLMLPAIFGSSVVQINLLLDTLIASFLVTGSISWLYYSDRLVEFPLGVFGIALATVILPKLSKDHATSSLETFSHTLDWALRLVFLVGTPAAVGLAVLAAPMLATLFYGGAFTQNDVYMASLSLMAYSLGLLGFILVKVLAPGFYSRQDTKTPVKIGIIAMVLNMILNIAFVVPLVMSDFQGAHVGLALATAASAFINALLLYRTLRKQGFFRPDPGWLFYALRIFLAAGMMGGILFYIAEPLAVWASWDNFTRIWHLMAYIALGAAVYFISLILMGIKLKPLLKLDAS